MAEKPCQVLLQQGSVRRRPEESNAAPGQKPGFSPVSRSWGKARPARAWRSPGAVDGGRGLFPQVLSSLFVDWFGGL